MGKKVLKYEFTDKGDLFDLTFRITENCNYGCSYCSYYTNKKGITHTEIEDHVVEFIKRELSDRRIRLCIYGGEPTLHPRLISICKKLGSVVEQFGIQTNLTLSSELLTQLIEEVPNLNFIPTYHTERVKKPDHFWKNMLILRKYDRLWHCAFLLPMKTFDEDFKLFKRFYGIFKDKMHPQPLTSQEQDWFAREELKPYLMSQSKQIMRSYDDGTLDYVSLMGWREKKQDQAKGWNCSAGKDLLFIDWDGKVYKCLSELYQGTHFAHISQHNLVSSDCTNCRFVYCGFSTDMSVWRPDE